MGASRKAKSKLWWWPKLRVATAYREPLGVKKVMIGLIYIFVALLLLAIYSGIIFSILSTTRTRKYKIVIIFLAVTIPVIYPFSYNIYPSHYKFVELCEADDRKIIHKTKNIDYLFLGEYSLCHDGFKYLNRYKGIECGYKPKENGERGNVRGVYRYIKGENWASSSCGENCLNKPYRSQKEECQLACMQSVNIDQFTNPFDYELTKKTIVNNRLYAIESKLIADGEVLAEYKNYTYYPYGNTWAKLLGASSGNAPTLSCEERKWIDSTEVYLPNDF